MDAKNKKVITFDMEDIAQALWNYAVKMGKIPPSAKVDQFPIQIATEGTHKNGIEKIEISYYEDES
jgi:hypothetical protein